MRYTSLQFCRAASALAVVMFHFSVFYALHFSFDPFFNFFLNGHVGVDFFFVLSGFVLVAAHGREFGQVRKILPFIRKRVTRIYPVYWFHLAFVILARAGYGYVSQDFSGLSKLSGYYLNNIFLLPSPLYFIGPSWSLVYELAFYTLFTLAFLTSLRIFLLCIGLFCLLLSLGHFQVPGFSVAHYFIEFFLGIVVFLAVKNYKSSVTVNKVLLGIVSLFLGCQWIYCWQTGTSTMSLGLVNIFLWGIPFAFFIWGITCIEERVALPKMKFFELLGDASFVLYISHTIFLMIALPILKRIISSYVSVSISYFLLLSICILYSLVFHLKVEKPLLVFFKSKARAQ